MVMMIDADAYEMNEIQKIEEKRPWWMPDCEFALYRYGRLQNELKLMTFANGYDVIKFYKSVVRCSKSAMKKFMAAMKSRKEFETEEEILSKTKIDISAITKPEPGGFLIPPLKIPDKIMDDILDEMYKDISLLAPPDENFVITDGKNYAVSIETIKTPNEKTECRHELHEKMEEYLKHHDMAFIVDMYAKSENETEWIMVHRMALSVDMNGSGGIEKMIPTTVMDAAGIKESGHEYRAPLPFLMSALGTAAKLGKKEMNAWYGIVLPYIEEELNEEFIKQLNTATAVKSAVILALMNRQTSENKIKWTKENTAVFENGMRIEYSEK